MKKTDIHSNLYDFFCFSYGKAFICAYNKENITNLKHYCINRNGDLLFTLPANYFVCGDYSFGNIVRVYSNNKYALFDEAGNNITDFIYDNIAHNFHNNFCGVQKDGKYGYINLLGKEIIPCQYEDSTTNLADNFALVKKNDKWGCIDIQNKVTIPFVYNDIRDIKNKLIPVKKEEKWGIVNVFNEVLADFNFDNIYNGCKNSEIYYAFLKGKFGLIDKFGNKILDFQYDDAYSCGDNADYSIIEKNNKYAFFNNKYREFITDFVFDCDEDYEDNFYMLNSYYSDFPTFPVRKNGKWAFMDCMGNMLTDFIYNGSSLDFCENLCIVKKDEKYGAVDIFGNLTIPCEYDKLNNSCNGVLSAKKGEQEGCINHKNEVVIPFGKYHNYLIHSFCEGIGCVEDEYNKQQYIKTNGEIIDIKIS